MAEVIRVPSTLNVANAFRFFALLRDLDPDEDYVFDFGSVGHTDPFGLLFLSDAISRFQSRQIFSSSTLRNHQNMGYQSHMGFFQASGFDYGSAPGQANGGSNYLPITHLRVLELREEARQRYLEVGEVIEEHAQRMAEVLARQSRGDVFDTLTYALREVMRNVVEHSESEVLQFCAQHWPTKCRVHLAILDRGRGIRASLSRNPDLVMSSDLCALKLALMPGVSGSMFRGIRRRRDDIWQNTGYGLYMTSRLAFAGGSFLVISGSQAYHISSSWRREIDLPKFHGTALRISIDTERLQSLQRNLRRFADEGQEIARKFQGADAGGASAASTMIRTRFR